MSMSIGLIGIAAVCGLGLLVAVGVAMLYFVLRERGE